MTERLAFLRGAFFVRRFGHGPGQALSSGADDLPLQGQPRRPARCCWTRAFPRRRPTRGGNSILYFKQSDHIEDFLTAIGAPVCAMGVMEAKVEKDLRNGVNRRVNCETANLTKVVDASMEQVAAIRKLQKQRPSSRTLPPKLRETAKLRLENPEATLQELAAMQDPPVSKSAMNHRMRKLVALANES